MHVDSALQATWIGLHFWLKHVGHCAGLVAGVFLLGYGLVEIPRGMWNEANPEDRLRSACYRCALLFACLMLHPKSLK